MKHQIFNGDCMRFAKWAAREKMRWDTVFADPFDNIGLKYDGYTDKIPAGDYQLFCTQLLHHLLDVAPVVWWSFNARHTAMMGHVVHEQGWTMKPCVQTFTFGQYRETDLGNNHRPLWRIHNGPEAPTLYPDAIRVPSQRMLDGDKRAAGPRVPGDVFDFPRVVGNSPQRRAWHSTQLNEKLVERCLLFTTPPGGRVLDPFGGTGTTLRVAKQLGLSCTLVEQSLQYCRAIAAEHPEAEKRRV